MIWISCFSIFAYTSTIFHLHQLTFSLMGLKWKKLWVQIYCITISLIWVEDFLIFRWYNKLFMVGYTKRNFFKKILEDISPLSGHWYPIFRTSGDVSSRFQSQSRQPYLHWGICVTHSLRFTYGGTPAGLLVISMADHPLINVSGM